MFILKELHVVPLTAHMINAMFVWLWLFDSFGYIGQGYYTDIRSIIWL